MIQTKKKYKSESKNSKIEGVQEYWKSKSLRLSLLEKGNRMRHMYSILLVAILLVTSVSAFAQETVNVSELGAPLAVTVVQSSDDSTVIKFEVGSFVKRAIPINGKIYYNITCGRDHYVSPRGTPALPRISRAIAIADTGALELRVISAEYKDFPNISLVPSKGQILRNVNPATVAYSFGPVYQSATWYPQQLAEVREPYILRDVRGAVVDVNAFQYNAYETTLRVYTSVVVELKRASTSGSNELVRERSSRAEIQNFNLIASRRFINYQEYKAARTTRYTPVEEQGEMLIIAHDAWLDRLQSFISHKQSNGITTTAVGVSTIGNSSTAIQSYVQNFYNSHNLAYLLLVGDAAQVATAYSSGGGSDPSYALLAGNDNYPDIFVGRFSAETQAQLDTQIARTLAYETAGQADWYKNGAFIGSDQGPGHNDEYDYQHAQKMWQALQAVSYVKGFEIYDPDATASAVTAALNEGCGVITYTGHGSNTSWGTTGFSNSNIASLNNKNMLPFIFSVACVNGNFTSTTCFAEAWLRATAPDGEPIGAIAMYASSINQSWNPPMDAEDEAIALLAQKKCTTFGGLAFNGSCKMIDINGDGGVSMFKTWNIFGDPSLKVKTVP